MSLLLMNGLLWQVCSKSLLSFMYYAFWSFKYSIPESSPHYPQDPVCKTTYLINFCLVPFFFNVGRGPHKTVTGQKWGHRCTVMVPALTSAVALKSDSAMSLRCDVCQELKSTCTLSQLYPPHSLPVMSELLQLYLFLFPLPCLFPLFPFFLWQRFIMYMCKINFFCIELAQCWCIFCWCFLIT